MKILLIEPPWKRFFGGKSTVPSLSLNSIASFFVSMNTSHEIDILDCDYFDGPSKNIYTIEYASKYNLYIQRLSDHKDPIWEEVRGKINNYNPDVVGITSMTASYVSALNVARIVKDINPSISVVMGGKHVSALPQDSLRNDCLDVVVIGEGEHVFYNYIMEGADPQGIKGLAYKDCSGGVVMNGQEDSIKKLDELPIPIFESKITQYHNLSNESWILVGSRGCPFSCIYCAESNTKIRNRSIDHIINEIMTVQKKYGIKNFNFGDDVFSLNKKRVIEFCNRVKELKLKIHWTVDTRLDSIDEMRLKTMRDANCYALFVGIETGSEKTMKLIKKKIDLKKCKDSILLAKKMGFIVSGYFIIGFPWEKEEDMKKTVNFMTHIGLDNFYLSFATPLPGTELFRQLEEQGKIVVEKMDWRRLYQGSPKMNYSNIFSDEEWSKLVIKYLNIANMRLMLYSYTLFLKKLIRNPGLIVKILSVSGIKRYILPVFHMTGSIIINFLRKLSVKSIK